VAYEHTSQKRKQRLDQLVFEHKLAPTREQARRLILAGKIFVDGQRIDKPGKKMSADCKVELHGAQPKYVSRGGEKLESAIEQFNPDVDGCVAIDVGASTGGFTDCLLQHGARRVYAVDVGYGQFAWKLRQDPRVELIERTNIRYFDPAILDEQPSLATIDVSFIGLRLVLPVVADLLTPDGGIIALVKPQFEAPREKVGKGGVVRDPAARDEAVESVRNAALEIGLTVAGTIPSPLAGPAGNIEFFIYLHKRP